MNIKNLNKHKIRIIGGKWKNTKFLVPFITDLRPTLSSIRETLFNWLAPVVQGSLCLDCFSGTGILGSEALSRYAKFVFFIEKNLYLNLRLMKKLNDLHAKNFRVITTNILIWLKKPRFSFDIVFIDPPYLNINLVNYVVYFLEKNYFLKQKSWIYIEIDRSNSDPIVPKSWKIYRKKTTKRTSYYLYSRDL
ncbi:ribosomal RNA small subunit methyltransferase D [Wigglesworthia glossinidia endosymbiont of Glossina morsitans morsitans (Yale colony)]|uniref:Ribosomal RNA small subunit methyltransferase D n=1 Tax=Wigglesworthia glossinidia endosymbiont of Glossina morsitans morsitans (Yale colony) TaxID=1142511 RepID=H6Q5N0_WIGGL|nr:16S rRNA (guanine(966)-N(2))-methyltransferase RsmD [Wigglesworthia glossinidia]AFA40934.1 ribosomal RNA small subunit methyltransferase D [Wigglesworthia glossinidia endosymbiont of Glossina morsitans morsitans (Yale colony)]